MTNVELPKICPVCGYNHLRESPYDEWGYPSYEICSCCGFEYGFDDESEHQTFDNYRELWINRGFPFRWDKDKPAEWSIEYLQKQLNNIKGLPYKSR